MQNESNISKFQKAPKIGLKPFGDSSYLNAVLQCLVNIRELAEYFLDKTNQFYIENNVQKLPLSFVIERLFYHLYPFPEKEDNKSYGNEKILAVLAKYNANYKTKNKRNVNDLINFLLSTMHDELNEKKTNITKKLDFDEFNQESVIYNGITNSNNSNDSIIYKLFGYFSLKENTCSLCNKTKFELHYFHTFDLDILGCSKENNNNIISINDCLNNLSIPKTNNFYCKNCRKNTQINSIPRIYQSPNIFIFLLDRGNFEPKYTNIEFKLEQNININVNQFENKFELIGIVSICLEKNKYVAFSKSPIDHQWYFYNDKKVDLIEFDSVLNNNNNVKLYIPFILFYHSEKNENA